MCCWSPVRVGELPVSKKPERKLTQAKNMYEMETVDRLHEEVCVRGKGAPRSLQFCRDRQSEVPEDWRPGHSGHGKVEYSEVEAQNYYDTSLGKGWRPGHPQPISLNKATDFF